MEHILIIGSRLENINKSGIENECGKIASRFRDQKHKVAKDENEFGENI
jgi:hypothetical protein